MSELYKNSIIQTYFLIKLVRNLDSLFFLEQDCEISEQNKRIVQENLTSENFDNHCFPVSEKAIDMEKKATQ